MLFTVLKYFQTLIPTGKIIIGKQEMAYSMNLEKLFPTKLKPFAFVVSDNLDNFRICLDIKDFSFIYHMEHIAAAYVFAVNKFILFSSVKSVLFLPNKHPSNNFDFLFTHYW